MAPSGQEESRSFQNLSGFCHERKVRKLPKEISVLGLDMVTSMWMWLVLEKLLERHSSFPGLALVPALFICSVVVTEPENSMLFIGTHQEILLLEFPFG